LEKCKIFPSIRFEYFLTLLKNSECIIGNSSAGIREAPIYGVPSIDIGNRQKNRYSLGGSIAHCDYDINKIQKLIIDVSGKKFEINTEFGSGNSTKQFMEIVCDDAFWKMPLQKYFVDKD